MSASDTAGKADNNTRMLTRVTAMLTALVAFNTLVMSCSERREREQAAALARAETEERFWEGAIRELEQLVKERPSREQLDTLYNEDPDPQSGPIEPEAVTINWLDRCYLLSQRTSQRETRLAARHSREGDATALSAADAANPEAEPPASEAEAIVQRAGSLQLVFKKFMDDTRVVGAACNQLFVDAQRQLKEVAIAENSRRNEETGSPTPAASSSPDPLPTSAAVFSQDPIVEDALNLQSLIVNQGAVDPLGYDIDVFWCDRATDRTMRQNIAEAAGFARTLANRADAGEELEGQRLGRIRLRRLSLTAQQQPTAGARYVSNGIEVRYDRAREDEKALADALVSNVTGASATPQSFRPTPWYLSAFFCSN